MTEQAKGNKGVSFPVPGQVPDASPPAGTPTAPVEGVGTQTNPQPAAITPELIEQITKEVTEKITPNMQSMVDTKLNTQQKKVQAAVTEMQNQINFQKQLGVQVDPAVEKQMLDQAAIKAANTPVSITDPATAPPPAAPSGETTPGQVQTPGVQQPVGTVDLKDVPVKQQELEKIYPAEAKVFEQDPEMVAVKMDGTPAEYLATLETAMKIKTNRLGLAMPGSANALQSPGGVGGQLSNNPIANINDPKQLIELGVKNRFHK